MKLTQRPYFIPAAALGAAAAAFLAGVIIVVTGSSGTTEATVASVTGDADIIVADVEPAPVPVAPIIEPLDSVADYTPEALETGDAAPDAVTPDTATPSRAPFAFDQVINKAQALSEHAFQESRPVPAAAAAFDYDQYRRLEFKRESAEWTDDTSIPFRVHYDPRGYLFNEEVKLNLIDKGVSTPKAWAALGR